MRVYPEKLAAQLQQQLLPVYLVTGEETLLVQECADLVRSAARQQGCTEREVVETGARDFDWQSLVANASSMSLFGDRKLLELRLPSGKPGAEGSKALCEYLERQSDDILLVISGKIDKQSTRSKWYKALDAAGAVTTLYNVSPKELPRWLRGRLQAAGLGIDDEALQLLSDRVEGNLLAAVQEVEKLKLLAKGSHLDTATVTGSVLDNARFNLFGMTDSALQGDARHCLRMLQGLRDEGTEAAVVLWALGREARTLAELRALCDQGQNLRQAAETQTIQRLWDSRQQLFGQALGRHTRESVNHLLQLASEADGSIKGFAEGTPWDKLEQLATALCQGG
ncbi:MAG: DNA polymerase III subunit delta [Pseudomonadota bacterium]